LRIEMTDTAIKAATSRAAEAKNLVELADKKTPGLRIRISPGGKRVWVLGIRDANGAARRFPLGIYDAMGIKDARTAAGKKRAEIAAGADPIKEARRRRAMTKAATEGLGTLGALIDIYEKQRGAKLKSWPECRRRIESVFARYLKKPLGTIKTGDLQMEADGWASKQSAAAAVRYIRPILKWASQSGRGYVSRDLADLSPPATVAKRRRALSRDELHQLLPVLEASDRPYAACLRFLMLTLARREEACAARWRDVDFTAKTWTISDTKNGRAHIVPLSRQAIALLNSLKPKDDEGKVRDPKPAALIFATVNGKRLGNWDRETKALQVLSKTEGWQRHDLRRTGTTILGDMGTVPHVLEAALNHVSVHSELAANYNQSTYRPQVAEALQRLADAYDGIKAGGATILPIGARA
jgi:integrase